MFGNIVLFGWPIAVAIFFSKYPKHTALLASVVLGYLLLPEELFFNLPVLPPLTKHTIPALSCFLILLFMGSRNDSRVLPGWVPRIIVLRLLLLTFLIGSVMTVFTNSEPLFYGPLFVSAIPSYEVFSFISRLLVSLLPFFMARKLLAYPGQQKDLLLFLSLAGAVYAFLALLEVRMSPVLNSMIYGFFPHSFVQHIRGDGFRPIVFLHHGLWLSIFFAMTTLAAFGLYRSEGESHRAKYFFLGIWMFFALIMSKSLGALAITLMLLPLALLFNARIQTIICGFIASIILFYPALRGAEAIPTDIILDWAASIGPDRADSLSFRLFNEDILLQKAQERPLFGWGSFGRNLVYNDLGVPISVPDGYWTIIIGTGGWVRYFCEFGLLCFPAIYSAIMICKIKLGLETSVLLLILVANLIDLIPNATITPLTWLIAGAVWGRIELGAIKPSEVVSSDPSEPTRKSAYTRFPSGTKTPNSSRTSLLR